MKFRLLYLVLLGAPCFGSQESAIDVGLEWHNHIDSEYWDSVSKARTSDQVLQALSDEQFVQLLKTHPQSHDDDNSEFEYVDIYIRKLKEIARTQKLVSDEIDCLQLRNRFGIDGLNEELRTQHRRFPRELGESTDNWRSRVELAIKNEKKIQKQAKQAKALRIQQLRSYALTGAKIGGVVAWMFILT